MTLQKNWLDGKTSSVPLNLMMNRHCKRCRPRSLWPLHKSKLLNFGANPQIRLKCLDNMPIKYFRKEFDNHEKTKGMIATYLAYAASGYFMDKRFVVAHFNYFCPDGFTTTSNYIPCECALQVFSLTEGLLPLEKVLNFDICGLIDPSPGMFIVSSIILF